MRRTAAAAGGDSDGCASAAGSGLGLRMLGVLERPCRSTGSFGDEWPGYGYGYGHG